jgi:hypothetical protein
MFINSSQIVFATKRQALKRQVGVGEKRLPLAITVSFSSRNVSQELHS